MPNSELIIVDLQIGCIDWLRVDGMLKHGTEIVVELASPKQGAESESYLRQQQGTIRTVRGINSPLL